MEKKMKTHELWHSFSPRAMTRTELDEALGKLGRTSTEQLSRCYASCYIRAFPYIEEETFACEECGSISSLIIKSYGREDRDIKEKYEKLAKEFEALGYSAKVSCYCDECVSKNKSHLAPIVFYFQADWMDEPVLSYPNNEQYEDEDYRLALDFLKGVDSASALYDIHGGGLFDEDKGKDAEYVERIKRIVGPEPQGTTPPPDVRNKRRGKKGTWWSVDLDSDTRDALKLEDDDGELPF